MLTTIYMVLLYGLYVPDWEYQIPSESSSVAPKTFSVSSNNFQPFPCYGDSVLTCYRLISLCNTLLTSFVFLMKLSNLDTNLYLKIKCGVRGDTGPSCNAVGMIDRKVLGIQHLYKRPVYARSKVWFKLCCI